MKWIVPVVLGLVAFVLFRPRKASAAAPPADPKVNALINEAQANWPGGMQIQPGDVYPADQAAYPGFYTTKYGGYFNPETGESYSPGSSPVSYAMTPEQAAAAQEISDSIGEAINNAIASGGVGVKGTAPPEGYVIY